MDRIEPETRHVEVSGKDMKEIANPIILLLNDLQRKHPVDTVLVAAMAAVGSAIRQRGALLLLDAPLREALPPLVWGYEDAGRRMQDA